MNTCKTCKHWDDEILDPIFFKGERENMRMCNNEKLQGVGDNALSAGEAWSATMTPYVGPDFGCIHHREK